jgi:hypothetical protein
MLSPDAQAVPVSDLPDEIMVYLLGSRYCETDRLVDIAWPLFSRITPGWAQVQAIVAYTHQRIAFGYEHARPTKTAFDAWREQTGVCRDYAHLAIALCRCMNIPARYCTGYLGDMDLPAVVGDMDFSAWFEVFLAGGWYTFDARHNTPRAGRILMARGRDAADAALVTTFGLSRLSRFQVHTDEEARNRALPCLQGSDMTLSAAFCRAQEALQLQRATANPLKMSARSRELPPRRGMRSRLGGKPGKRAHHRTPPAFKSARRGRRPARARFVQRKSGSRACQPATQPLTLP